MKRFITPLLLIVFATACQGPVEKLDSNLLVTEKSPTVLNKQGATLEARFTPPDGYRRMPAEAGSFATYLRQLKLKPDGAPVLYFDGREKANPNIYVAVVDMEIGDKDLQQCADAVMRLRAEWLWHTGKKDAIHFHLTNGFDADYSHWAQGYRVVLAHNKASWVRKENPSQEYAAFRNYLDFVFNYAGTLSLSRELKTVAYEEMKIGDVFIIGGSPGHAITVMDMAQNRAGQKVYMLSQGYMPAQDIQILHNPLNATISPWYELNKTNTLIRTPQWDFTSDQLKRFKDQVVTEATQ